MAITCCKCSGKYKEEFGSIILDDKYIKSYAIHDANYLQCEKCGNKAFPSETHKRLDAEYKKQLNYYLKDFPLSFFITIKETLEILNIDHRSLRNIKKIFFVEIEKNKLYLRKSVEQYKETKDGRFNVPEALIQIGIWRSLR